MLDRGFRNVKFTLTYLWKTDSGMKSCKTQKKIRENSQYIFVHLFQRKLRFVKSVVSSPNIFVQVFLQLFVGNKKNCPHVTLRKIGLIFIIKKTGKEGKSLCAAVTCRLSNRKCCCLAIKTDNYLSFIKFHCKIIFFAYCFTYTVLKI